MQKTIPCSLKVFVSRCGKRIWFDEVSRINIPVGFTGEDIFDSVLGSAEVKVQAEPGDQVDIVGRVLGDLPEYGLQSGMSLKFQTRTI